MPYSAKCLQRGRSTLFALVAAVASSGAVAAPDAPLDKIESATPPTTLPMGGDAWFRQRMLSWTGPGLSEKRAGDTVVMPVEQFRLSSKFGVRVDPLRGTPAAHAGIDIPAAIGTPIYATAAGRVAGARYAGGYGNLVTVDHGNGVQSRYGHLSRMMVGPNDVVGAGQLLGLMGSTGRSTGSHVHYEVRVNGRAVDPIVDPKQPEAPLPAPAQPLLSAFARDKAVAR